MSMPKVQHQMPPMLAYTLRSNASSGFPPSVIVGMGNAQTWYKPQNPVDDSYWILLLDATNPKNKVKDFVVPGQNNTQVPAGLDDYMKSPQYIFAVMTQNLSMLHVPQSDFYDYLVKYGASRELQRMEQIHSVLSCGTYSRLSYILTGQCGPRGGGEPSYEKSSTGQGELMMMMSLMPLGVDNSGNPIPPYSLCDSYTFRAR